MCVLWEGVGVKEHYVYTHSVEKTLKKSSGGNQESMLISWPRVNLIVMVP